MSSPKQFLLLLTALMSALTGVLAGPRGVDARPSQAEAQLVAVVQAIAPASAAATRPEQPVPALTEATRLALAVLTEPKPFAPLTGVRLNE